MDAEEKDSFSPKGQAAPERRNAAGSLERTVPEQDHMLAEADSSCTNILEEGQNCWRIRKADRVAFLIDSASYFSAFVESLERAEQSVFIIGWDIDSRIELVRGDRARNRPTRLAELLRWTIQRKPRLHVHILCWDFAMVFALQREFFPVYKLRWPRRRLHFRFDGNHPPGSSHHQKVVVIDDKIGFVGGIDFAKRRWDRPSHAARDKLRIDVAGKLYPPTHDVQMAVDGAAAASLGDLARERWRRASGRRLQPPNLKGGDAWPPRVTPDVRDVDVAIARTEPVYKQYREVQEIERLYADAIGCARRVIYIENQYFTSAAVSEALSNRLRESGGPEVILVLPQRSEGWLSELTMDVCRSRLLKKLRAGDPYNRLRVYHPVVPKLGGDFVEVHSKVFVVDDRLMSIGSSNLNNRSMGMDTECDLALEARGNDRIVKTIAAFRSRLLGHHLGVSAEAAALVCEEEQSFIAAIEKLRGGDQTLAPLETDVPELLDRLMPDSAVMDPENPIDAERLLEIVVPEDDVKKSFVNLLGGFLVLLVLVGIAGAWRWTALGDWLSVKNVLGVAHQLSGDPLMPLFVFTSYLIGGLVFFPVLILIIVTAFLFGPVAGFVYSLGGCLLSAAFTYGMGRVFGRDIVRRLGGAYVNRLSRRLGKNGILAVFTARIFPVAPFSTINIIAGASHIRFRDFVLGTLLGMVPGILMITVFGGGLKAIISDPSPEGFAFLAFWIGLIIFLVILTQRWISRYETRRRKKSANEES